MVPMGSLKILSVYMLAERERTEVELGCQVPVCGLK